MQDWVGGVQQPGDSRWSVSGLPDAEVTVVIRRCSNWYRLTWGYDALTVEDAATFDLTPEETINIGRVDLVEGATLTGRVTARRTGEPLPKITVADQENLRSGEPTAFRATTDADGRFAIEDVQPGSWKPVAYHVPLGRATQAVVGLRLAGRCTRSTKGRADGA